MKPVIIYCNETGQWRESKNKVGSGRNKSVVKVKWQIVENRICNKTVREMTSVVEHKEGLEKETVVVWPCYKKREVLWNRNERVGSGGIKKKGKTQKEMDNLYCGGFFCPEWVESESRQQQSLLNRKKAKNK